jgi:hypothetical protein
MGVKYLCQFAKKCAKLKMLLHVSTGQYFLFSVSMICGIM